MSESVQEGPAIVAGYEWRCRVKVTATPVAFPVGVALTAHVRRQVGDASPLVTLTTGAGSIVRVADDEIDLVIAPASSLGWRHDTVVLDLVRTDVAPDRHMGFSLTVPVVQPVTRGLA